MGDFNATTSAAWTNTSQREGSVVDDLIINNNGERFHELFDLNKLSVLNTWFTHKKCRRITWHSADGKTKKVYDFIVCASWLRKYVSNCRVYNSYDFDSDHKLVIAKFTTPTSKKARFIKRNKHTPKQKIDFEALTPEMSNIFTNNVTNKQNSDENFNNVLNEALVNAIKENADNCFPAIIPERQSTPWQTDEKLQELFRTKSELTSVDADPDTIKRIRKKIRLRARYLKNEHFKHEANKLNAYTINKQIEKLFTGAKKQETTLNPIPTGGPLENPLSVFSE